MVCLKIDTSHTTNQVDFRVLLGLRLHSISRETCKKCFFSVLKDHVTKHYFNPAKR